ncbi:hypothetical protein D8674_012614 [Pyrus ussuriensis x Pyrus communis]|uniref:Uncharacterized protein n=1 Tax=Pyrus ussuriensis x Pyrus communis TaxID=2448454 RepID=A0A5N5G257_9ROSA|nr:hypothetical protein D8674_012614 [Pyrus ussuriensis x Pyrus communis]
MISYYALVHGSAQVGMFTGFAMLGLEISLVGFLLQGNYASGVEALAHTFLVSGIVVGRQSNLCVRVWGTTVHRWHRKYIWSEVGLVAHPQIIACCTLWIHIVCAFLKIDREVTSALASFGCGLAGFGASFGICFLLENAYYSEMKDAGFFDADWD